MSEAPRPDGGEEPRAEVTRGTAAAHGRIFDAEGGALHVHLHRDHGLAHRHLVLSEGQVRALRILFSRPMVLLLIIGLFSMGWITGQAARVPLLKRQVTTLTADLERIDSLTKTLEQLQANYERLQAMLGATAPTPHRESSPTRPSGSP